MTNNNEYLSQEEIDALLKNEPSNEQESEDELSYEQIDDLLTTMEQDALGEIGNITFGTAATALSTLLGKKVEITTPQVSFIKKENMEDEFPKPHVAVHVKYVEGFEGINSLIIKLSDASVIADLMLGGDGTNTTEELNEIHLSAVEEAMNQMMGSAATSMSTIFDRFVNISPPSIDILDLSEGVSNLPDFDVFIKVSFRLTIGDLIDSTIMQLLPISFAQNMVQRLLGQEDSTDEPSAEVSLEADIEQDDAAEPLISDAELAAILAEEEVQEEQQVNVAANSPPPPRQQAMHVPPPQKSAPARDINVQPVQYSNLSPGHLSGAEDVNLNLLLDIPLRVTVELGRTSKPIKEILEFAQGSIIELDKLAGEPVDILANNKMIAKGEVVVIDENFGVRVTEIVSQADRIYNLQ